MILRSYWIDRLEDAWAEKSVVWLAGVRRSGKTTLCKSLSDVEYFDCEYPDVRTLMNNPRVFLDQYEGKRLIIDEIHNLENPSQLLKIAADYYPSIKIIATGSSTFAATQKFKDALTDRYVLVHMTPMLFSEGALFGNPNIEHRMLFGGLPPFFMKKRIDNVNFQSWIDSFWAKDIQKLFRVEKHPSFLKFIELILAQSGGMFEATRFAHECEVARSTITKYLSILNTTYIAHTIKPYSKNGTVEIISAPKVYGFDTGFICHARSWYSIRPHDLGVLWEHLVLNELRGRVSGTKIRYWRDKKDHEIDFVLLKSYVDPIAIECKWTYRKLNPKNIKRFRSRYPVGKNYVVCADVDRTFEEHYGDIVVKFISLENLIKEILTLPKR